MAAYYSKVSNREVLDQTSRVLYGEPGKVMPIVKSSWIVLCPLGHIIRSDETDHMRTIAIDAEHKRSERAKKHVGWPRFYWLREAMKRAHRLIRKKLGKRKQQSNIHSEKNEERVANTAAQRAFPLTRVTKGNDWKGKARRKLEKKVKQTNTSRRKQTQTTTQTIGRKI